MESNSGKTYEHALIRVRRLHGHDGAYYPVQPSGNVSFDSPNICLPPNRTQAQEISTHQLSHSHCPQAAPTLKTLRTPPTGTPFPALSLLLVTKHSRSVTDGGRGTRQPRGIGERERVKVKMVRKESTMKQRDAIGTEVVAGLSAEWNGLRRSRRWWGCYDLLEAWKWMRA